MPKITDQLLDDLAPVYFVLFAVGLVFSTCLRFRLKRDYPKLWANIGSTLSTNSIGSSLRWLNWILGQKYEETGDPRLSFYGQGTRLSFLGMVFFLLAMITLGLIGVYQDGELKGPIVVHASTNPLAYVLLALVIPGLAIQSLLLTRLKKFHSKIWEGLGQPSIFLNNNFSNNWQMMKFIWSGRYWTVKDAWVSSYATATIILTIFVIGTLILHKSIFP